MEKCLDSQLWHACAGGMVQMPPVNSKVFYFPQGHAEHAQTPVDFGVSLRIPGLILCRVAAIKFLADSESDEVYAKLRLMPVRDNEIGGENGLFGSNGSDQSSEKPASFAKTLTQSDANNGGGFSVPRYCAETIFPRLDYSADPPVQTVIAKDVHGEMWKFRHIYRGTPRRHLLTTGWSSFVNQKKLIAGDSIVFLRADNGDLCIGIRRAKRGIGGGPESPQSGGWNHNISHYGGFSVFLREDENKLMRTGSGGVGGSSGMNLSSISGGGVRGNRKLRPESVIEAASLAASGQPFEVVYYPRASTPEFCVKASAVKEAMQTQWYPGMRFKMAFETEDSSRISWFMGTISSVQVADTIRWPSSPWRLLQVSWDEPDLLQNVKRVSPWLVELVSNMPVIHHMTPFSPPRKKLRLPQHMEFPPFDGQIPLPSFNGNPLGPNTSPAGIQGARHAQFGISLSDLYLNNKLTPSTYDHRFDQQQQQSRLFSNNLILRQTKSDENVSCLLTMGISSPNVEKSENVKRPHFLLFGQPILTEEQICSSGSSDAVSQVVNGKCSSEEDLLDKDKVLSNDQYHCMVFTESDDVGQKLDLSVLGSYEELYRKLTKMYGLENSDRPCQVLYRDVTGALKHAGDEPFSIFVKTAKRLTVLTNGNGNNIERKWMTGLGKADSGLESSSKTGPSGHLSIFA